MTIDQLLAALSIAEEMSGKIKRRIEGSRLLRKIVSILLPLIDGDESDAEMEGIFTGGGFRASIRACVLKNVRPAGKRGKRQ